MESNIYYHSECDFQLKDEESITEWLKDAISTENKELGEINYIFCLVFDSYWYFSSNPWWYRIIRFFYFKKSIFSLGKYF